MTDLVARLRGQYRTPITDGLGPAGDEEPDNPSDFVRTYETPPIQHAAADRIEELVANVFQETLKGFAGGELTPKGDIQVRQALFAIQKITMKRDDNDGSSG